ncbi:MAG: hypothetical protein ACLQU2_09300 [Candidatus Binataceae bacterium]
MAEDLIVEIYVAGAEAAPQMFEQFGSGNINGVIPARVTMFKIENPDGNFDSNPD